MTPRAARSMPRGVLLRISDAMVLLAMAVLLGTAANLVRPQATRLPWVSDWDRHIETLAFRAGIPVTFLNGAQTRVGDPATAIIDARLPDEFAAGHLPRAWSLPVADVEQRLVDYVSQLTPETPILVYCGGSECDDALELAKKLREFGFEDVTLYPGGIAEWVAYGGAIHTGSES